MSLKVVKVAPADVADWQHVVSWVYAREAATEDSYPPDPGETRYLARVGDTPVAACAVYSMDIARQNSTLRCGGVAGVATLAEHRQSGAADALMRFTLEGMRADGYALSALYAFRSTYYRRFGYENCGWRWQIKCPADRLPKVKSDLPIKQWSLDDLDHLNSVYVPFIRSRSGSPLRASSDWTHRMGKKPPMVYAIGEPLEAYLWVNIGEFWGEVTVGEFAWTSLDGYRAGLKLLSGLCSNQTSATWMEPPDSPFVELHMDQGATAQHARPTMFRVVDVRTALSSIQCDEALSFAFEATDSVAPWNQGVWTVETKNGTTRVEPGGKAAFQLDVRHIAQALMGQPDLRRLAATGHVAVFDQGGFDTACRFLPPSPVVCMDFF